MHVLVAPRVGVLGRPRALRAGLALAATVAGCAMTAETASAQQGTSCRGSATRYEAPGQATSEPVVANTNRDPCVTDSTSSAQTQPQGGFTASNPRASTNRSAGLITAFAAVDSVSGGPGAAPVTAGAVESSQVETCQDGRSVSSGSSRVENVAVGGTPIPVAAGSQPSDTTVPTLGGDVRVRTNQVTTGPEGTRRTALIIDFNGTRYTAGEAIAGGDACLALPSGAPGGTGGGGGTGGNGQGGTGTNRRLGQVCPRGAELDVARTRCVIRETGANGATTFVVVGRPFEGPNGAGVITLAEARRRAARGRLPNSSCLRGSGPAYVVLGTNRNDNVTGTDKRDRILGLAGRDRLDGGRGDDCIDGGKNRDVMSGALGADRLFGGNGNDSLNGGPANDRLSGGSGNDSINAAFGRDLVSGGSGRDAINVATSGPAARVNCGAGRDTVRANTNERRGLRGCETRFFLR